MSLTAKRSKSFWTIRQLLREGLSTTQISSILKIRNSDVKKVSWDIVFQRNKGVSLGKKNEAYYNYDYFGELPTYNLEDLRGEELRMVCENMETKETFDTDMCTPSNYHEYHKLYQTEIFGRSYSQSNLD